MAGSIRVGVESSKVKSPTRAGGNRRSRNIRSGVTLPLFFSLSLPRVQAVYRAFRACINFGTRLFTSKILRNNIRHDAIWQDPAIVKRARRFSSSVEGGDARGGRRSRVSVINVMRKIERNEGWKRVARRISNCSGSAGEKRVDFFGMKIQADF